MSSGVTSPTWSPLDGVSLDRDGCWGSISWTVDLNRTVGPTFSSGFGSEAEPGASWEASVERENAQMVSQEADNSNWTGRRVDDAPTLSW